jgi:hypothetical protein
MTTANRFYAAVGGSSEVFNNWVTKNKGSYVYPKLLTIALVHEKRYTYVAANVLSQILGRSFAGAEFLDNSATPDFRSAVMDHVVSP